MFVFFSSTIVLKLLKIKFIHFLFKASDWPEHKYNDQKLKFDDKEVARAKLLLKPSKSSNPISQHFGVCYSKAGKSNNWCSYIQLKNKKHHIGLFKEEMDAAKAYDKVAKELSNKQLNFRKCFFFF